MEIFKKLDTYCLFNYYAAERQLLKQQCAKELHARDSNLRCQSDVTIHLTICAEVKIYHNMVDWYSDHALIIYMITEIHKCINSNWLQMWNEFTDISTFYNTINVQIRPHTTGWLQSGKKTYNIHQLQFSYSSIKLYWYYNSLNNTYRNLIRIIYAKLRTYIQSKFKYNWLNINVQKKEWNARSKLHIGKRLEEIVASC